MLEVHKCDYPEDNDYCSCLLIRLVDESGNRIEDLYFEDGGCPEDQILARDWSAVYYIPHLVKAASERGLGREVIYKEYDSYAEFSAATKVG